MTIRSRMSSIMGLIRRKHLEVFALELENYFTVFTHQHLQISTNQHKTWSKYI